MTGAPFHFSLWHAPWIRATCRDGTSAELGIGDCLTHAHTLAALHDPAPLVVGGVHRLLTAIVQAIYAPRDLGAIAALLAAGHFDPARLADFAAQHGARFDLFHPRAPFLQTGDVPLDGWRKPEKGQARDWGDPKSIAALFAEVPSETNRAHFQHVTDEHHRVCPACCARGLIVIPAFASSGGQGIRPSINGVPPVYVLPAGRSLFEALALSTLAPGYQPTAADPQRAAALWHGPPDIGRSRFVPAVGYLESLTFPARRTRLYPLDEAADCTLCGQATPVVVRQLLYEMGHWRGDDAVVWDDPFAAFRLPRRRGRSAGDGPRPVRPEEGKALWREYSGLLLTEREEQLRPRVVQQVSRLIDRGALPACQAVQFRCIGVRTDGKAKLFEWIDEALDAPPALLTDLDAAARVDAALVWADVARYSIEATFDRHFRPARGGSDSQHARFKTVRARMLASYWQRLAAPFRGLIADLVPPEARDAAVERWADTLIATARQVFETAAGQVGSRADALRARVLAQAACARRLAAQRKEWIGV